MKIESIKYYHVTMDEPEGMEIDVTVVGDRLSAMIASPTHDEEGNDLNQTHEGVNHCSKAIEAVRHYLKTGNTTASIPAPAGSDNIETPLVSGKVEGTFVPIEEETLDGHAEAAADERASLAKPKPGRPMKEDTVQ
jgi:hypothetical protein